MLMWLTLTCQIFFLKVGEGQMDVIHSLVFLSVFKESSTLMKNAQQVMANLGKIKIRFLFFQGLA